MTKMCTKCKITKSLDLFHRDSYSKDGHSSICKSCRNVDPDKKQKRTNNMKVVVRKCCRCGEDYTITSYRQKYCVECQRQINKEICSERYYKTRVLIGRDHLRGESANGYKNGIGLYPKQAKEVGKCSRCGSSSFLVVHHLDRNRENNHSSNLEVICKSCHQKEHVERDALGKFAGSKDKLKNMC